jgi:Ca2+-binding EF-hand superfamily protein
MERLFKKYDKDNSNTLSRGEFIQLIKDSFKEDRVNSVVGEFLNYSDKNGDGVITYNEFKEFFG